MNIKLLSIITILLFTSGTFANPITHLVEEAAKIGIKSRKLAQEEADLARKATQESSAIGGDAVKLKNNPTLSYMTNLENSPYYINVVRMVNKCKQTEKSNPKFRNCEGDAKSYETCMTKKVNDKFEITQAQRNCEVEFKI
jgi:hypothetical protein